MKAFDLVAKLLTGEQIFVWLWRRLRVGWAGDRIVFGSGNNCGLDARIVIGSGNNCGLDARIVIGSGNNCGWVVELSVV